MWPNCTSYCCVNVVQHQLTGSVNVACGSSLLVLMWLNDGSQYKVFC